jgi:hypothetical protein
MRVPSLLVLGTHVSIRVAIHHPHNIISLFLRSRFVGFAGLLEQEGPVKFDGSLHSLELPWREPGDKIVLRALGMP